jgi:hypothetical protein
MHLGHRRDRLSPRRGSHAAEPAPGAHAVEPAGSHPAEPASGGRGSHRVGGGGRRHPLIRSHLIGGRRGGPALRWQDMTHAPLPIPVAAALEAANAGATEDFLATFAEDGAVDDWGRVFHGRDAIRSWSDAEFIGKQVRLTVTGCRTDDDTTTVSTEVGGHGYNGPSDFAFTVANDRVTLMRITG